MNAFRLTLTLLAAIMVGVSFCVTVYGDYLLEKQKLNDLLHQNTSTFAQKVLDLNIEIYEALYALPLPPKCDELGFESVIFKNKHIKNVGIIENDSIICDAYVGDLYHNRVVDYDTFTSPEGKVFKFWADNDYISVASPEGYFIQYDTDFYLDFLKAEVISGFVIYGRQSKQVWFHYLQHPLSDQHLQEVNDLLAKGFSQLNTSEQEHLKLENADTVALFRKADGGSIVASFVHSQYNEPFHILNFSHIFAGLLLGFLFSFLLISLILKQRTRLSMLKRAIKRNDFHMVYQPLVDIHTGEIKGFEALVRWQLSNGDYIRPDVFIPIAEEAGLTKALTRNIIELIFEDLNTILKDKYVSINITPSDLADDSLINLIKEKLAQYEIDASHITAELTERIIADESHKGIEALRQAGIKISIDDFGTGSSNIHYLAKLKPDVIKVDRSFVVWSETAGPTAGLLEQLITLGKSFDLSVVVEGVETESQAKKCISLGADIGQGYFWYKPMPIRDLKACLENKTGKSRGVG